MSLKPQGDDPIPETTARVAHSVFPKGNAIMRLSDALGSISTDEQIRPLFSHDSQPTFSPERLALVTILQFAEGLFDPQASQVVRAWIDWKYTLVLEVDYSGFDASVLCEFWNSLIAGQAEQQIFESRLKASSRQRTNLTDVLSAIVTLNSFRWVGETMCYSLNAIAIGAPDWLEERVPTAWFEPYTRRFEEYRFPTRKVDQYALVELIGAHGRQFLLMIDVETEWAWPREVSTIQFLGWGENSPLAAVD